LNLLVSRNWTDYSLIDSGEGAKLERFGSFTLARPESQAIWRRSLPAERWAQADATFEKGVDEGGAWTQRRPIPERWLMSYSGLHFWARLTSFRHTGVFPEQAAHWDWIRQAIEAASRPIRCLDLFAYTALSSLAAARAGATVTYVDASRPAMGWARENAAAAGLGAAPIRWILDDAIKFVKREARRGATYDALILDPPVFGRGPNGEIWRFFESVPILLDACRAILSDRPLLVLLNAYASDVSSLTLSNLLADLLVDRGGTIEAGELALPRKHDGHLLTAGVFARWTAAGGGI
ncbi:MAG TPA: class I SAM-dependent methyltransferase, partial [Chloroflexota bacterium]|nr:class I SAM-dependent methyltransferase [Chloroflexota bacterium]